jgi:hypothetical protein
VTDIDAWHELAKLLDGRLTIGDLSIAGKLDGLSVDLGIGWEGSQPVSVHVAVGDPEAASAELREIAIALPRPASDVLVVIAAERLIDQLTRWPEDLVNLRVADGVASASHVLSSEARPAIDVARVRELVHALRAVLAALDPGGGPYR